MKPVVPEPQKNSNAAKSRMIGDLRRHRLIAVLRSSTSEEALATADAVAAAGVKFVEITLTVPGSFKIIETLAKREDLYVAAGTVLSTNDATRAIAAGARIIVSPALELELIPAAQGEGAACVIGAATPTEILTASRAGADLVKIFPADCLGGTSFVRQILGPMPDLRLVVSGGVDLDNLRQYVELGVVGICLSSSYLKKVYAEGGQRGTIKAVRPFVEVVQQSVGNPEF